jgi:hypothetical protein
MFRALIIALCAILFTSCNSATPNPTPTSQPTPTSAAPTSTSVPTVAPQKTNTPEPTPQPNSNLPDFAPKQRSVWDTTIGPDTMRGECPKGSVLPVYGLVQITPNGDTLEWKNQEPAPYVMKMIAPNVYGYSGENSIKDGRVIMTATFSDEKNFAMTREYVANDTPTCTHVHEYKGVFKWNK